MTGFRVLILILSALVMREAWLLLPEGNGTFDPFPFYDIQIAQQTYFYFAFYYGSNLILIFAFLEAVNHSKEFFHLWFGLQAVELIDYFLTYNTAWFMVGEISVGITMVKLTALTIMILALWYRSSSHSKP